MNSLLEKNMGVSENSGTPKSSILIGISIINHPFWGTTIFGNTHIFVEKKSQKIINWMTIIDSKVVGWKGKMMDTLQGINISP